MFSLWQKMWDKVLLQIIVWSCKGCQKKRYGCYSALKYFGFKLLTWSVVLLHLFSREVVFISVFLDSKKKLASDCWFDYFFDFWMNNWSHKITSYRLTKSVEYLLTHTVLSRLERRPTIKLVRLFLTAHYHTSLIEGSYTIQRAL